MDEATGAWDRATVDPTPASRFLTVVVDDAAMRMTAARPNDPGPATSPPHA